MQIKKVLPVAVLVLYLLSGMARASDLNALFEKVEKLKLERYGYVLGHALNPAQMKTAAANPVEAVSKETFKFKDRNLYVVAQKTTNRVLVLYEQVEAATRQKIQGLIGDLYMKFDAPTVMAHDKVVYWAYGEKGKITATVFDLAKQDSQNLEILATVKCVSEVNIMDKTEDAATGNIYYIISSDPILRQFGSEKAR